MAPIPWKVHVVDHLGSSLQEVEEEPDWQSDHQHRIGFKNRQGRFPGFTHTSDKQHVKATEQANQAAKEYQNLADRAKRGDLINFRDIIKGQKDLHLQVPDNRSVGWRFVLNTTEDWVKYSQPWPVNLEKEDKDEEEKRKKSVKGDQRDANETSSDSPSENDWRRKEGGGSKHHDAYAKDSDSGYSSDSSRDKAKSEYEKLCERYTAQEMALLRCLQNEKDYIKGLAQNDGQQRSPVAQKQTQISIDEADQFSPDNWVPRSSDLIRLTGKHPLNAEPHLSDLFDAGLITPNGLHYVRNHGAVPHLLWEFHELDIENGKLKLSMDDLKDNFDTINIPVILACDGNRRKELNMIRRSKGFNWGAGAVSCAFWKGPLLRDVLESAGVDVKTPAAGPQRLWVNFEGADEPSEGKYATCLPFEYAIDPANDVILAYEMNDEFLPPDHGYPLRLIIPGYVGGRCVKWLKRIWINDQENDSHYHIWDNRVLPAFVTEKDGEFATALFNHPDTACNEQNLNSVIVKPAQGEAIPLDAAKKGKTYRIEGYAYDGGGHEVQRVEISLDGGETWLYCIRKFPDFPIRHGNKYWTWLHWHIHVEITHLLQAKSIIVRCFNVFKNTQPEKPNWNTMGMMNNCYYVVRPEIVEQQDSSVPAILFRHPVEPGTGTEGWMQPSVENKVAQAKQDAGAPDKQFTREEIEKHDNEESCWIVVDEKVYDATSVLSWHLGGKAAILGHAGKVHQETSDEFGSVHDEYAYKKLKECILGVVTDKAKTFINSDAAAKAKEAASSQGSQNVTLQKHRWVPVKLIERQSISADTNTYTFDLPTNTPVLGLGTCQHVQLGFHFRDRMLIRSYTPTQPVLPPVQTDPNPKNTADDPHDGTGTFTLTVKTYAPSSTNPGGAMSNILDCIPLGSEIDIRGPTGEITYQGGGKFDISGEERTFHRISLVLGGSGITPGYALIARILNSNTQEEEGVEIRVLDANRTEADILLKEELDVLEKESKGRLKITHVLSHAGEDWRGKKGHVDEEIVRTSLFAPGEGAVALLCGPPGMIKGAALPALKGWGYVEDANVFGF